LHELLARQQRAHAAALQHRIRDERRLRPVMARLDQALQLSWLHPAPHIDVIPPNLSSWY